MWMYEDGQYHIYREIRDFELMLRRLIRWEMTGKYGRLWLFKLGNQLDTISRIEAYEKRLNLYEPSTSELSYLSLTELLSIIFLDQWRGLFEDVFGNDKGLAKRIQYSIVPIRNKIAHFRPVRKADNDMLGLAHEVRSCLEQYYSAAEPVEDYLSSDPELLCEQIEPGIVEPIVKKFSGFGIAEVWQSYGMIEGIRALGVSLGLGIGANHFFIEMRWPRDPPIDVLNRWTLASRFCVTSVVISGNLVRMFFPYRAEMKELRKSIRAIGSMPSSAVDQQRDVGNCSTLEYLVDSDQTALVSMGF